MRAYPKATFCPCPGLEVKRSDLSWGPVLGDEPLSEWSSTIDQARFDARFEREIVFYHRASKTMICADALLDLFSSPVAGDSRGRAARAQHRAWKGLARVHRRQRLAPGTKAGRPDSSVGFDRVILAHGALVERDGREVMRDAYRWLCVRTAIAATARARTRPRSARPRALRCRAPRRAARETRASLRALRHAHARAPRANAPGSRTSRIERRSLDRLERQRKRKSQPDSLSDQHPKLLDRERSDRDVSRFVAALHQMASVRRRAPIVALELRERSRAIHCSERRALRVRQRGLRSVTHDSAQSTAPSLSSRDTPSSPWSSRPRPLRPVAPRPRT